LVSAYIGSGALWGWLQNIVGVSNQVCFSPVLIFGSDVDGSQIAWLSIGLSSWRFRKAWVAQGRPKEELKFTASWTWPWGPVFVVVAVSALIISMSFFQMISTIGR
jgi:amino acid permease